MNLKELKQKVDESFAEEEARQHKKRLRKHITPAQRRKMKQEELEKKMRFEMSMLIMLSVIFVMGLIKLIRG